MTAPRIPVEQRFWTHVRGGGVAECWLWTGYRNASGYGLISSCSTRGQPGRDIRAHRWAYEFMVAPIPAGLELDHLCRDCRRCHARQEADRRMRAKEAA